VADEGGGGGGRGVVTATRVDLSASAAPPAALPADVASSMAARLAGMISMATLAPIRTAESVSFKES